MSKQGLNPEKYIRTKARSLPIYECFVNGGWQEAGMAFIMLARKHSTGKITFGTFQVDVWDVGLKYTHWEVNVEMARWNKLKNLLVDVAAIDYNLAHNIIFGGIEFAEAYGFKPHKDFAVSQFILEDDDERIPVIEVDFGVDGKPHVLMFREDKEAITPFNLENPH